MMASSWIASQQTLIVQILIATPHEQAAARTSLAVNEAREWNTLMDHNGLGTHP